MLQPKQKVTIDYDKCQPEKCERGICVAIPECPVNLWKQEAPYDSPYPIAGFCQECGKCVDYCPLEAISML